VLDVVRFDAAKKAKIDEETRLYAITCFHVRTGHRRRTS
jgi:hypothetical protein